MLPGVSPEGTDEKPAGHLRELRDRLRVLYQRASKACPQAIVRAAEHLESLHDPLTGCMETLGGPRSGEKWRKALSAVDRVPNVLDVAYLSTLPQAEPRAAVRAYARRLLHDVGDTALPVGTISKRVGQFVTAAAALNAKTLDALADDAFTAEERRETLASVAVARVHLDAIEALARGGAR